MNKHIMVFKITLAVFLAVTIGRSLNIESPFYAGIAAVITLQSGILDSLHAGKNRLIGTTVGALVGAVTAYLGKGNLFFCCIGIAFIVIICQNLKLDKSLAIACVVFLAINVNFYGEVDPLHYSAYRIFDTFLGVCIVFAINLSEFFIIKLINSRT